MKSYPVRIKYTKNGRRKQFTQSLKAVSFQAAYDRAGKSFASWIKQGYDVQVFNPGENHNVAQSLFKGEH